MRNGSSTASGHGSEVQWRERIAEWSRSGETIAEYCARRGLSRWTFYDWKRKLTVKADTPSGFVQVDVVEGEGPSAQVTPAAAVGSAGVEVVLCCGRRLRLDRGFDRAALSAAVAVLEGPPC